MREMSSWGRSAFYYKPIVNEICVLPSWSTVISNNYKTNTGKNGASKKNCLEGGSENPSRAKQSIGGVVPLQPACPRRGDTSLDVHNS